MRAVVLGIVSICLICGCKGQVSGRSEEELVSLYKQYHGEKNLDGMMTLFWQDGTPDFILKVQKDALSDDFNRTITNVKIQPMPEETKTKFVNGFPYKDGTLVSNIEPLREMVVEFATDDQGEANITGTTIMIGKSGETHYFVLSKFKEE